MKASTSFLLLFLIGTSAIAQERVSKPDFSREAVQRFVMRIDVAEDDEISARYDPFFVNFAAFGTTWRMSGMPQLMMPLSGTAMGVTQTFPDPFALTRTSIATGPRAWRTRRAYARELKSINKRLNADIKVRTRK